MKVLGRLAYVVIAIILYIFTASLIATSFESLIPSDVMWQSDRIDETILGMVTLILYAVCYMYAAVKLAIRLEK